MLTNQQYYRSLIFNKQEATFLADLDGDILLINQAGQDFTGYLEDEIKMYSVRDIFITTKNEQNPLEVRQLTEINTNIYLINASHFIEMVTLNLREIEGNKFLGTIKPLVASVKNLPEQKTEEPPKKETENQENQIQSAVFQPQNDISEIEFEHHLRNKLNVIVGYSTILSNENSITKDTKLKKYVDQLLKSGNELKLLFNTLTNYNSENNEIVWTPCSLSQVLQRVQIIFQNLAKQQNVELVIKNTSEKEFLTDEKIFFSILQFLIEKAILYTRTDFVEIITTVDEIAGEIHINIDNLGQDIPQGVIHLIKRENNKDQYDYKNPLLGMYKEIQVLLRNLNSIEAKIDFNTNNNLSEIATVKIPVRKNLSLDNVLESNEVEQLIKAKNIYVLVVEDEKINANIFKMFIENIANVSIAHSGNEAMNIIEIFYNQGILFNIVFLDIGLPDPWDGFLLKKAIEKKWSEYANIQFIAQTAYTNKQFAEQIANENFKGYLTKPLNKNDVLKLIGKIAKKL